MHALRAELSRLEKARDAVRARTTIVPRAGLVLGSGLGGFASSLEDRAVVPYDAIPGMPTSKIEGHAGNLVLGRVGPTPVVAMQGRVHLYEGHDPHDVVFGARLMRLLGADTFLITNAAGGCGQGYAAGDLMLIADHLNLTGKSSLTGTNESALGPRFPDMSEAYDRALRALAHEVAAAQGFSLQEGVYAGLLGPSYETPAEIRMLQTLGAQAVGMSTVLETIAVKHMGAKVLGISCITNLAAGISKQPLSHDEVTETATRVRARFEGLLRGVLLRLGGAA